MKAFFTLFTLLLSMGLIAKRTTVPLEKAVKAGLINIKVRGTGIYKGECIKLSLINNKDDSLIIWLEAGRRLDSRNNHEQDILITKDQFFVLGKRQTKDFMASGFCCQLNNHAPGKDSVFFIGKKANPNLSTLAGFCNINKFSINDTQSAVWCVSDKRPLASIPESNEVLRKFVAKITKEEIPWYQIEYEKAGSNTQISQTIERISGNIAYTLPKDGSFKIELRNAKGYSVQDFASKKMVEKGNYDYWFDLQVSNFPQGSYFIYIYSGSEIIKKKGFEL